MEAQTTIVATDTASEAAVDITELDTTILDDGRGRVTVTIRVFNTGFDAVGYDGSVVLSSGATTYEQIDIRGEAGAGADADTQTLRLETDGEPPTTALLTVALANGDQEQQTVQFIADDPGLTDPEPFEVTGCSTSRAFNDGLNVQFSVDGSGGESFEATIRVDGQAVDSQTWTLGGVPPTTYEQIVDPSDLPTGEEMPVEVGVNGNFSECGTATVSSSGSAGDTELAREIIDATDLRPGDAMTADALGEVSTAWGAGQVSTAAYEYAQELFNNDGSLPDIEIPDLEPPEVDPASVTVNDCSITSASDISVGETARLFAEVANGNNRAVEAEVRFEGGGMEAATLTTVAAGRTGQAEVEMFFNAPGEYQIDAFVNSVEPL